MSDLTSDQDILANTRAVTQEDGQHVRLTITLPDGDELKSEPITQEQIKQVGITWCDTVREQVTIREQAKQAEGLERKRSAMKSSVLSAAEEDTTRPETAPGAVEQSSSVGSEGDDKTLEQYVAERLPNLEELYAKYTRIIRLAGEKRDLVEKEMGIINLMSFSTPTGEQSGENEDDDTDQPGTVEGVHPSEPGGDTHTEPG